MIIQLAFYVFYSLVLKLEENLVSPLQPKQYYEYKIFKIRNRNNSIWIKPNDNWEEIQLSINSNRKLKFYFPFFGHMIQHVRMLYSGIISLSDFDHLGNIHESQYIAPMMADFAYEDPKCKGFVLDNGKMAVFTWTNCQTKAGVENQRFNFQLQIYPSGKINFVYLNITANFPEKLVDMAHPIIIGLSDAYVIEHTIGQLTTNQIVTYHKIDLKDKLVAELKDGHKEIVVGHNEIVVNFQPMKTCNQFRTCWECTTHGTKFNCIWCSGLKRCSDNGIDRNYQVHSHNFIQYFIYNTKVRH